MYSLPSACSAEEELASDGLLLSAGLLESERKLMQPGVARLQKRACKLKEQRAYFSLQQPLCLGSLTNAPSASGVLDVPVRRLVTS